MLRHRGLPTPAIITGGGALQPSRSTSYDELHAACMQRCIAWQAAGMRAGASICLVGALEHRAGDRALVRAVLGGVVSLLPALGPDYLRNRLGRLRPDFIATARTTGGCFPKKTGRASCYRMQPRMARRHPSPRPSDHTHL